uniref:Paraneoplastic antigen Ma-like C-terminal domain-containing protein n=1 Tax=Oryzias sinensis TaxID=183150 RepID=A0A8C7WTM1_9TELE
MDVFMNLGIKIPNSVRVEGISVTEEAGVDEVIDFLKQYGRITRTEMMPESCAEFDGSLIIEFNSGETIAALRHMLPYTFNPSDKTKTYFISELSTVYAEYIAKSKTQSYLTELQNVAKLSGMDFAEVLKATMAQIGQSVAEIHPAAEKNLPADPNVVISSKPSARPPAIIPPQEPSPFLAEIKPHPASWQHTTEPGERASTTMPDFNPPEVQRYVVEHIVKSEASVFPQKLKVFSGRLQRPAHEADYETWRSGVDLLLRDPSVSDLQCSRRIVDSLLPPAADVIKHLSTDALLSVYLDTLDSAYGTVQDGDELFAKFMDTFQNNGEKPSSYLHRLQVALNAAAKRGGVKDIDASSNKTE